MNRALCIIMLLIGFCLATSGTANAETAASPSCPGAGQNGARIDVNTASPEKLTTLRNIGPSRAQAILEARAQRPFRRVEDILRVHGIGRTTFRQLRDCICVRCETEP